MSEEKKSGLKFHLFDVTKIVFERNTSAKEYVFNINIEHTIQLSEDNPSNFQVYFHIAISSNEEEKPLNLQVEAVGNFELVGNLPDDVDSNYKNISAPSIVYPYIRAFLSNLTLQSGINPINLPPINFANKEIVDGDDNE